MARRAFCTCRTRGPARRVHSVFRSWAAIFAALSLLNYLHDDVMVRRFHADPLVRSVELLLQEKVPYDAPPESPQPEDARGTGREPVQRQNIASPWNVSVQAPAPQAHFISN